MSKNPPFPLGCETTPIAPPANPPALYPHARPNVSFPTGFVENAQLQPIQTPSPAPHVMASTPCWRCISIVNFHPHYNPNSATTIILDHQKATSYHRSRGLLSISIPPKSSSQFWCGLKWWNSVFSGNDEDQCQWATKEERMISLITKQNEKEGRRRNIW